MKISLGAKTLLYPLPVWGIGTYDKQGNPNIMTAAWGGICCSVPPCVAISLRKATYTYDNIMEHKAFTVNVPSEKHIREIDYFGMASGENADKFSVSGLTPVRSELVNAPYVKEFPVVLECEVIHCHEIGLHTQFVGQISDVKADPDVLSDSGLPDIEKVAPIIFTPETRQYHRVGNFIGQAFSVGKDI